ncbi:hypothetical protein Stube_31220 [Streptomyces tubercidicus]|uniref:Uncharacterized protein n=1 Tax=Streptomyces tubercidicus TaxID=47759 RepID=A0A640URS4_9ACTN|nr:hypothetical protein Stube_31220 [Streptomyces tubercidicus]
MARGPNGWRRDTKGAGGRGVKAARPPEASRRTAYVKIRPLHQHSRPRPPPIPHKVNPRDEG